MVRNAAEAAFTLGYGYALARAQEDRRLTDPHAHARSFGDWLREQGEADVRTVSAEYEVWRNRVSGR